LIIHWSYSAQPAISQQSASNQKAISHTIRKQSASNQKAISQQSESNQPALSHQALSRDHQPIIR
jgi:hypothetical protein